MTAIVTLNQTAASLNANLAGSGASYIPALQTQLGIGSSGNAQVTSASLVAVKDFAVPGVTGSPTNTNVQFDVAPTVSFGSWNGPKSVFTFNRTVVCAVSASGIAYAEQSPVNNITTFRMHILLNGATVIADASAPNVSTGLVIVSSSASCIRQFNSGDTVSYEVQCAANTPSGVTTRKYGGLSSNGLTTATTLDIAAL